MDITMFLAINLLGQFLYFLFLRKHGAWLGWTILIGGLALATTYGLFLLILGALMTSYVLSEKKFLPNWANRILYHPKLNKP